MNWVRALGPVPLKVRRQPSVDCVRVLYPYPVLLIVARIGIIAANVHHLPVHADDF